MIAKLRALFSSLRPQAAAVPPLLIGATGGSGTRALRRCLMAGDAFMGERVNDSGDAMDFEPWLDDYINPVLEATRTLDYRPEDLPEPLRQAVLRDFQAAAAVYRQEYPGGRWGWKCPRTMYLLPVIHGVYPDLWFIHLLRDGRDMAFSGNQNQPRKHYQALFGDPWEAVDPVQAARLWAKANGSIADWGERVLGPRYLTLRFEDLCARPRETLADLFTRLELPTHRLDEAAALIQPPDSIGRWREQPWAVVEQVSEACGDGLGRFGYRPNTTQVGWRGDVPAAAAARPALSMVVVCYNMAREIPRTMRSLSQVMQRGIGAEDYEVILVDNGSKQPFDEAACRAWIPNLRIEYVDTPTVSPVPAVNRGLELARGELVGVMIDGARLVSPGLLRNALAASRLYERPVIGTPAFHLGPDVQKRSVPAGYNQEKEDELLAASGWEEDGYRLFDIATFAGSSALGWFVVPAETSTLFLKRDHWTALGGYDPGFKTPGGGLVNLDTWARACADSPDQVVMLLGEATFHQVHGGVYTNSSEAGLDTLFHDEYLALRGQPYRRPEVAPLHFGHIHPAVLPSLQRSADPAIAANLAVR